MHRLTALGQWAVELLQRTTSLPGGSGQWNSCNALPHCLGAVGSGTPAMHRTVLSCRAVMCVVRCWSVVVWAVSVLWCLVLWCASLCCVVWFFLLRCFYCSLPYLLFWRDVLRCGAVVPCDAACGVLGCSPCVVFRGVSCAVLCCAVLVCLCCVGLWCVLLSFGRWLVPGVASCFSLPLSVGLGFFCPCLLPAVVFWWRVLSLESLSGRVAGCAVVCCGSPQCPAPLCCVLWCRVFVWCRAVEPCCLFCFFGGVNLFLLPFISSAKFGKNGFPSLKINQNYTQRQTRASHNSTNIFLT